QHGHHRTAHEEAGDVHQDCAADSAGLPTFTFVPGASRSWPTVTTISPAFRPLATTVSSPSARAIVMLRSSTVESGLTTNTYCPVGPLCTAADGVTIASFCSCKVSTTLTNWPGHRALSVLGNSALSLIVPVVASAALSMNDRRPATGGCAELAKLAATLSSPAA